MFKLTGHALLKGDWDENEITKLNGQYLKSFWFRTTGPILTKVGTKYPCV